MISQAYGFIPKSLQQHGKQTNESSKMNINERLRLAAPSFPFYSEQIKINHFAAWLVLSYTWMYYKVKLCCPYLPGTAACLVFHIQDSTLGIEDSQFGGDSEKKKPIRKYDWDVCQLPRDCMLSVARGFDSRHHFSQLETS